MLGLTKAISKNLNGTSNGEDVYEWRTNNYGNAILKMDPIDEPIESICEQQKKDLVEGSPYMELFRFPSGMYVHSMADDVPNVEVCTHNDGTSRSKVHMASDFVGIAENSLVVKPRFFEGISQGTMLQGPKAVLNVVSNYLGIKSSPRRLRIFLQGSGVWFGNFLYNYDTEFKKFHGGMIKCGGEQGGKVCAICAGMLYSEQLGGGSYYQSQLSFVWDAALNLALNKGAADDAAKFMYFVSVLLHVGECETGFKGNKIAKILNELFRDSTRKLYFESVPKICTVMVATVIHGLVSDKSRDDVMKIVEPMLQHELTLRQLLIILGAAVWRCELVPNLIKIGDRCKPGKCPCGQLTRAGKSQLPRFLVRVETNFNACVVDTFTLCGECHSKAGSYQVLSHVWDSSAGDIQSTTSDVRWSYGAIWSVVLCGAGYYWVDSLCYNKNPELEKEAISIGQVYRSALQVVSVYLPTGFGSTLWCDRLWPVYETYTANRLLVWVFNQEALVECKALRKLRQEGKFAQLRTLLFSLDCESQKAKNTVLDLVDTFDKDGCVELAVGALLKGKRTAMVGFRLFPIPQSFTLDSYDADFNLIKAYRDPNGLKFKGVKVIRSNGQMEVYLPNGDEYVLAECSEDGDVLQCNTVRSVKFVDERAEERDVVIS
ncbi:unnamed protein product [Cunninghamella echinulata]